MLKHLLLALLFSVATAPAIAQTTPGTSSQAVHYQYCTLLSFATSGRDSALEYGQHAKPAVVNPELEAINQEVKKLDSGVVALTYLCSHGWEYVAMSAFSPGTISFTQYLIRRPLP